MGHCFSKQIKVPRRVQNPVAGSSILVTKRFKLIDFTDKFDRVESIGQLEAKIGDYSPTDIRCMRYSEDTLTIHSFVVIRLKSVYETRDIGMMIMFNEKGFKLTVKDSELLPNIEYVHIEKIHFPRSDKKPKGGLREIIRWTYEHKDELYVDPQETPELNMGTRVYEYVRSLISDQN